MLPEAELNTALHIQKSHAGAPARSPLAFPQKKRNFLFRNAEPVVPHCEQKFAVPQFRAEQNFALVLHALHAVVNRILQNRLEYQFYRTVIPHFRIDLVAHAEAVLKADFLNIHIIFRVPKLRLHRNDGLAAA